ncbi:MAG: TIGR01212 family radical SAM protein [Clostridia bacterium]|nr:TIGR01212 family radical SAM protein [Clostridia bacterium]
MDHYYSLSDYCKETFGEKLYKLTLESGCTCPNRDGLLDTRGCIFCSAGGSGDFAAAGEDLEAQLEAAKARVRRKSLSEKYIAYYQSFTGTYPGKNAMEDGSFETLRQKYLATIRRPEVAVLSIATRPDCLGPEVLEMLREMRAIKPVWVELGLQTSKEKTAEYIRRCYKNEVYEEAVRTLKELDIPVITHLILGLPGETYEDMEASVRYACDCGTWGLKLQLLHVLEGTDLGEQYKADPASVPVMDMEEYIALLCRLLPVIPKNVVIHRLTGDGPKRILLAPLWSGNKRLVLNTLQKELRRQNIEQGSHFSVALKGTLRYYMD